MIEPARTVLLRGQSDERLVALARAGEERAFDEIVRRYRRPLVRHCSRLLPRERAEDAVQQALLRAYDAIGKGDAELRLRPWLYRIAQNSALNALRQNGWDHVELSEHIDGVERPPEAFERRQRLREVVIALKDLPPRQRDAIVLREFEGRSYAEISAALEVSDGAVRQLLNRARSSLRASLTALTPPGLMSRLADGADAPVAQRIADAGGAVAAIKVTAGVLAAGGVLAGAPLAIHGAVERGANAHRSAAAPPVQTDVAAPYTPAAAPEAGAHRHFVATRVVAGRPGHDTVFVRQDGRSRGKDGPNLAEHPASGSSDRRDGGGGTDHPNSGSVDSSGTAQAITQSGSGDHSGGDGGGTSSTSSSSSPTTTSSDGAGSSDGGSSGDPTRTTTADH